jgi:hypothetical protein
MLATPRARLASIKATPEERPIAGDYAQGRRDGLRLALAVLAAEEAKWAALLGESSSWRTNSIRQVRHKTLQVAQTRVQTVLNRFADKDDGVMNAELVAALDKVGL